MITQAQDKSTIFGDITTGIYWILYPTGNLEVECNFFGSNYIDRK